MNCPRCRTPLTPQQAQRLVMHCCYTCGGLFLDGAASRRVVEAVDPSAMAAAQQASQSAQRAVATDAVAPCPVCTRALDRMPIPAASVTVDVCGEHGVWFDRDELQRVVQAVAPQRTTPVPMAPQGAPNAGMQPMQPIPGQPIPGQPMGMQPIPGQPMAAPPMAPPMAPANAGPMPAGMAPGQYVAPGWLDDSAQKPFGGMPSLGASMQQPGQPAMPGMQPPGAPAMPGQPGPGGWGLGKTALAVGAGVAAVAGVAYVASHSSVGRQAMGVGPHASGFGAVGDVLSKLF